MYPQAEHTLHSFLAGHAALATKRIKNHRTRQDRFFQQLFSERGALRMSRCNQCQCQRQGLSVCNS